jgi:hypothetical protein
MPLSELEAIQLDGMALSVARAVAIANEAAAAQGVALERSLVTITEQAAPSGRLWHVHYGPRDYTHRRGGDLTVVVDDEAGTVQRIIRGQ